MDGHDRCGGTCGCILAGYTISLVSKQNASNELSLGLVAVVLLVVSFLLMARAKLLTIDDDEGGPRCKALALFENAVLISSRQSVLMTGLVVFSAVVLSLVDINFKFEVRSTTARNRVLNFMTFSASSTLYKHSSVDPAVVGRAGHPDEGRRPWRPSQFLPALLLLASVFALIAVRKRLSRQQVYHSGGFLYHRVRPDCRCSFFPCRRN